MRLSSHVKRYEKGFFVCIFVEILLGSIVFFYVTVSRHNS